jgi:predicted CXXCH cytochrome family protein
LCHVAEGQKILTPEIPDRWLPRARFDHQTHRFQSCDRCHDLREAMSADLLALPRVETCRACHNRGGARASCVTCHPFHPN